MDGHAAKLDRTDHIMAGLSEKDVFAKTVYAEARGEPSRGQEAVADVIKNRAAHNKDYWGGNSIKDVCLKPGQFECWNGVGDIPVDDPASYEAIKTMTDRKYDEPSQKTGGPDHYHNRAKEGHQPWVDRCDHVEKIGEHDFYKTKSKFM